MRRLLRNLTIYAFQIAFARPIVRWIAGVRYRRKQLVPKGPCIVVSNHNSHLDAAVLLGLFPLRRAPYVHPVAAADYFGSTRLRRMFAMAFMNAIPIERRPTPGKDPLQPIKDQLERGHSLIFFPEGSRGEAGVIARFRPGIGRIVKQVPGVLVVPVYLAGPERIWPRGQTVPVPLNIEAVVGRPRSYPPELDARDIAERVQRDVVSLAPPPPPAPGSRPQPIRVAVCGIDNGTREEVFRRVVSSLGRIDRTIGLGERSLEADADGAREVDPPIVQVTRRVWVGLLAAVFRLGGRFRGRKFAEMVEQAQINEALWQGRAARFVVTAGSALVDLLSSAEADFYADIFEEGEIRRLMQYLAGQRKIPFGKWWRFIRKAPEVWLISEFDLARPPQPTVLVLASPPVRHVMERLRSRGAELQPWETEAFLQRLSEAHRRVGEVLRKRHRVELVEADLSQTDPASVAADVEALCRQLVAEPVDANQPT